MAKSRMSVSASRALLGLGVLGLVVNSASAVATHITKDSAEFKGESYTDGNISFGDLETKSSINMDGLKGYTVTKKDGSTEIKPINKIDIKVAKSVAQNPKSDFMVNSDFGLIENVGYDFDLTAEMVVLAENKTLSVAKNKTGIINGNLDMQEGSILDVKSALRFTDTAEIIMNGKNNINIAEGTIEGLKVITAESIENKINIATGKKLVVTDEINVGEIDGGSDSDSLMISGGLVIAGALNIGKGHGQATLSLNDTNMVVVAEDGGVEIGANQSGGNTINLTNSTLKIDGVNNAGVSGTVKGASNQINMIGKDSTITFEKGLTVAKLVNQGIESGFGNVSSALAEATELFVKGGALNVKGGLNIGIGKANHMDNGESKLFTSTKFLLDGVTAIVDDVIVGEDSHSFGQTTINLKDSSLHVTGTFNNQQQIKDDGLIKYDLDNSTVTVDGLYTFAKGDAKHNLVSPNKGLEYTLQNGSHMNLNGGLATNGVPRFIIKGDNNTIKINQDNVKTEWDSPSSNYIGNNKGDISLAAMKFQFYSNDLLLGDSVALMESVGNGKFIHLNGGTTQKNPSGLEIKSSSLEKVGFIRDAAKYLNNQNLLASYGIDLTKEYVVADNSERFGNSDIKDNYIADTIIDAEADNGSALGNLLVKSYELSVSEDGKKLFIKTNLHEGIQGASKLVAARKDDVDAAEDAIKVIEVAIQKVDDTAKKQALEQAKKELEAKIESWETIANMNPDAKPEDIIKGLGKESKAGAAVIGSIVGNESLINGVLFSGEDAIGKINKNSENVGNIKVAQSIAASLGSINVADSAALAEVVGALLNPNFLSDTFESAKSATSMSDTSSSVSTAINVANDMSIGNRVALYNNPYHQINEAKRFAALDSDAAFDYYDSYKTSVWANVFGGTSIIDGNNGALFGLSAGIDGNLSDEFLLGAYVTYANAELKTDNVKQKGNNFQLGAYTQYKFAPNWELNAKASVQFGLTDQDRKVGDKMGTTDFTRTSAALNANVGRVILIANAFYIKPFAGFNYYYSYTPSYTETGLGLMGQKVKNQTNNSLSLEVGAEFRAYVNEGSYIYVTPKIEQFVANSTDEFIAGFIGSTQTFTVQGDDKNKTYGQLILGGNFDVNDALSLNAGVGVKQILAGKVNDNNETFITGNVGLKYRF